MKRKQTAVAEGRDQKVETRKEKPKGNGQQADRKWLIVHSLLYLFHRGKKTRQ